MCFLSIPQHQHQHIIIIITITIVLHTWYTDGPLMVITVLAPSLLVPEMVKRSPGCRSVMLVMELASVVTSVAEPPVGARSLQ
jgi:hypothetical protein